MNKLELTVTPKVIEKVNADKTGTVPNQAGIEFSLLRTYPVVNSNGDSYDYERTKRVFNSVDFGYINLEHNNWINVGTIVNSDFVDDGEAGRIDCSGILWKSALDEFDIDLDDIRNGRYQISMEVLFNDYYIMHGDERIDPPEAEEYVDLRGQVVDGREVSRVVVPLEYSGAALTEIAADPQMSVNKVIAKKLEEKTKGDIQVAMRDSVRTPNYSDTESISWGDVTLTFAAFRKGYYAHEGDEPESEEDIPTDVGEASAAMKSWIAARTLLGDREAETADDLIVLPVVNPRTDSLNENGLVAARQRASQVTGITEDQIDGVMRTTSRLLEEEFDREVETEEAKEMAFKTFETEEEYNEHVESLKAEATEGMIEIDEVLNKFSEKLEDVDLEEANLEDIENVDDIAESFQALHQDFEEYKMEVAKERTLRNRKDKLAEEGIEIEELDASEEDIAEMEENTFELIIKSFKTGAEKAQASQEEGNDEEANKGKASDEGDNFDPTGAGSGEDKKTVKEILNGIA